MLKLLAKYSDVISSYKISRFEHFGQILRFRAELIMRWDNAPDWAVETFPRHVHVGKEDTVEPSFDRTLDKLLKIVRRRLVSF